MLLLLFEFISDIVIIGINNLFQSFDPAGENASDCLNCESAQNCLDNMKKFINLGDMSGSELYFQPAKEKEV
jgi:hypothetical protein